MDEEYDAIVLGTGLKECILSGLLSSSGKKVLHMDRNSYYGGESASLNLQQLFERFRPGQEPPKSLGSNRDWNVDMVPKFIMANGKLVRALIKTDVTKYMDFKAVDGSYVLNKGKVHKVPATDIEALRSPLMGLFEKRRARSFFLYVQDYEHKKPSTHKHGYDLTTMSMDELYKKFGLDAQTIDFIGHAIALHRDESYLSQPALPTVEKVKLYHDSLYRYEGMRAPYIYPNYGLGELPQAFARLSAVYGGTYMLNRPDAEVVFDEAGRACGVRAEGQVARCNYVVGDPSYFPDKTTFKYKVLRAICVLNHPIPNTGDGHSVQIIVPQRQVGRQSDMYVFCSSYAHNVAPQGRWIAFVSTTKETQAPPEAELAPGLALLGPIEEKFVYEQDVRGPLADGKQDGCFISCGYDATTHFETGSSAQAWPEGALRVQVMDDVADMYERILGQPLDLSASA